MVFEFDCPLKQAATYFTVIGIVTMFLAIIVYNAPQYLAYFLAPGGIMLIIGIVLNVRVANYYAIKSQPGEIWYYKRGVFSNKTEVFYFKDVSRAVVRGKKERRSSKGHTWYVYHWWLTLILKNSRELTLTDKYAGEEDRPLLEVNPREIAEIIGCPAVISASYFKGDCEIYHPEKFKNADDSNFTGNSY